MVYSTCSMNPVENEAVVAEVKYMHSGLKGVEKGRRKNILKIKLSRQERAQSEGQPQGYLQIF